MIKYYLYFPEEDNEVINSDDQLIHRVFELSKFLKGGNEIYYDENNIDTYSQKKQVLGVYLADGIDQLRVKLFKLGAKSINTTSIIKTDCVYIQWNLDQMPIVTYTKPVIADLAERYFQFPEENYLLINLDDAIDTCRQKLLIFKDAKHLSDMPSPFAKIDYVINAGELEIWQQTHDKTEFTLLNRTQFRRTTIVQQGKPVFEEIVSGNYWYLDNFHRNEYEVFDSQHSHIGVANLNGVIDTTKKINGRTF